MRRNMFSVLCLLMAVLLTACDDLSVNERVEGAPVIASFSPEKGSAGMVIEVEGERLSDVVSAKVGGVDASLSQKISDRLLRITVPSGAVSGRIALTNAKGEGVSESDFTVEHPAPVAVAGSVPSVVEMGNKLLIRGTDMNVISAVVFTAEGMTEGHEAEIISQGTKEIVVKVPYVEKDNAVITFRYFDGQAETSTTGGLSQVQVLRYQPKVTTTVFSAVSVGDQVTLEGEYLDKVNSVTVGGVVCQIASQTASELRFTVPTSASYVDGDNLCQLAITYFDGVETAVLTEEFTVRVPYVYFWQNKSVYAQGRDVAELASFFSPETGQVYHNSMWRETVDPVSYQRQAATCSAAQKPAVTETEYNSVRPYFFFSGVNAGNLQINSPAGSNGQLKNFYYVNNSANDYRVTGSNGKCYGTPVMTYLWLDPTVAAHNEVIQMEKSGQLERIDETTFAIDEEAKTCRGISIAAVSNTVNEKVYAKGVLTAGTAKDTDLDSYLLVFYYDHNGLDADNKAKNIKRIGLLHITHIDFRLYNNTVAPSSSCITFDMYWMKHDYKH